MKPATKRLLLLRGASYQTYLQSFVNAGTLPLWLPFTDTAGSTITNYGSLGAAGNGAVTGTLTLGQTGGGNQGANQAALYDGLTANVTVPAQTAINNISAFTIAALVNPAGAGEASDGRICVDNGQSRSLSIFGTTPFRVNLTVAAGTTATSQTSVGSGLIVSSYAWLFATYDDAGDRKGHFYAGRSGAVAELAYSTQTAATGVLANGSGVQNIGNNTATSRTWNGLIDELLYFNRVLTTAEMTQIVQMTGV